MSRSVRVKTQEYEGTKLTYVVVFLFNRLIVLWSARDDKRQFSAASGWGDGELGWSSIRFSFWGTEPSFVGHQYDCPRKQSESKSMIWLDSQFGFKSTIIITVARQASVVGRAQEIPFHPASVRDLELKLCRFASPTGSRWRVRYTYDREYLYIGHRWHQTALRGLPLGLSSWHSKQSCHSWLGHRHPQPTHQKISLHWSHRAAAFRDPLPWQDSAHARRPIFANYDSFQVSSSTLLIARNVSTNTKAPEPRTLLTFMLAVCQGTSTRFSLMVVWISLEAQDTELHLATSGSWWLSFY